MKDTMRSWWRGFVTSGTHIHQSDKDYRLLVFLNVSLIGGAAILLLFSVLNLWIHGVYKKLGVYEALCAPVLLVIVLCLRRCTNVNAIALATTVVTGAMLLLMLILSGGLNLIAAWLLVFPLLAFLLLGHRRGLTATAVFGLAFAVVVHNNAADWLTVEYPALAWANLCGAGLLNGLFAFHAERVRAETALALETLANKDALTHLPNRRFFSEQFEMELERSLRHNHNLSLLVLDVDHFKAINDRYGHEAGDSALVHLAATARRTVRKQDTVARLGGEEFAILLPETDLGEAYVVAEKLRQTVQISPATHGGDTLSMTISIGVAELAGQRKEHDALFSTADLRLYQAKRNGRNQVVCSG